MEIVIAIVLTALAGLMIVILIGKRTLSADTESMGDLADFVIAQKPLLAMANAMGWPKQWIICPSCAAHSWRIPPHLFDGCPVILQMSNSAGLKLDAERTHAVRAGITMERQMEILQELVNKQIGDDDE